MLLGVCLDGGMGLGWEAMGCIEHLSYIDERVGLRRGLILSGGLRSKVG